MSHVIKFVDVGDNHGEEENTEVTAKLFAFMDDFKPDLVIHGGDNWNFSHLRMKASPKEANEDSTGDWHQGVAFMTRYFRHGKQRIFLRGNHDERLWTVQREAMREDSRKYAERGIQDIEALCRKLRVKMYPYNSRKGVLDLDGLRCIHGYAHGIGAARKFAASYGTCIYHHTHATDVGVFERWPEPSVAYGTGCLMHVDQNYNAQQMNKLRHENAWVYGWIKDGVPSIFQARMRKDGKFLLPHEIREY